MLSGTVVVATSRRAAGNLARRCRPQGCEPADPRGAGRADEGSGSSPATRGDRDHRDQQLRRHERPDFGTDYRHRRSARVDRSAFSDVVGSHRQIPRPQAVISLIPRVRIPRPSIPPTSVLYRRLVDTRCGQTPAHSSAVAKTPMRFVLLGWACEPRPSFCVVVLCHRSVLRGKRPVSVKATAPVRRAMSCRRVGCSCSRARW